MSDVPSPCSSAMQSCLSTLHVGTPVQASVSSFSPGQNSFPSAQFLERVRVDPDPHSGKHEFQSDQSAHSNCCGNVVKL